MAPEVVVIGASLGGLRALETLLPSLPPDFRLPIVLVQHRSKDSDGSLESLMQRYSPLPIVEVEDMTCIEGGRLYIAPPDYHLMIERGRFRLSTEAPVRHARPSIDVLLESAADAYGTGVVAVILTGTSHDGADGVTRIARAGGHVLVQQPETAEARMMPDAAIAGILKARPAANVHSSITVSPIEGIATALLEICECPTRN